MFAIIGIGPMELMILGLLVLLPALVVAVTLFLVGVRRRGGIGSNLHPCRDCNQPVSIHATACPHCGCPVR